jgi:hypothetical protein
MQERAAGSPPITAWVLLALGVVGLFLGLLQAPGIISIAGVGNNASAAANGTATEEAPGGTPESSAAPAGSSGSVTALVGLDAGGGPAPG